jgi:hypothetical protein
MKFNAWLNSHLGANVRYNKSTSGYQCVDLIKSLLVEVDTFKFYDKYPTLQNSWAWGNARDFYEGFKNHKELTSHFKRIPNTPSFKPIEYDICIFTEGNKLGHICVAYDNSSTTKRIYSADQNYPTGSKVHKTSHTYDSEGFLGVLRPTRTIKADVNVRVGPGTNYACTGEIKKGSKVDIIDISLNGKWANLGDNRWISYNYVEAL